MTIDVTLRAIDYIGDGVSTVFSFPYPFSDVDHIKVLGYSSGFSVDTNGDVTFSSAPASGESIVIYRETPQTQLTDYISGDDFPEDSHEAALDKLTMETQEVQEQVNRSLRFALKNRSVNAELPAIDNAAGKYLIVNSSEDGIAFSDGSGGGGATSADLVSYNPHGTSRSVEERLTDSVNVKDFGAVGDGVTDDSAAIQAAIDAAAARVTGGGGKSVGGAGVYLPGGRYFVASTLVIDSSASGVSLFGDGQGSTWLECDSDIVILQIGHDGSTGADTAGLGWTWNVGVRGIAFRDQSGDNASVGIQAYKCPGSVFNNLGFQSLNVAIDGYRFNYSMLSDINFWSSRASTAAFIRLNGTYDSTNSHTPGGNLFLQNINMHGNSGALASPRAGLLIRAVDGIYVNQMHAQFCDYSVMFDPDGSDNNKSIADAVFENCYFDDPTTAVNGANVRITGNTGSVLSHYSNIRFIGCLFRGANKAEFGLFVNVQLGTSTTEVENIQLTACRFRQHVKTGIQVLGPSTSGMQDVDRVAVHNCAFRSGNYGNAINYEVASFETRHVVFNGNTIRQPANLGAQRAIQHFSNEDDASLQMVGNDFLKSNRTRNDALAVSLSGSDPQKKISENLGLDWEEMGIAQLSGGSVTVNFSNGRFPSADYVITVLSNVAGESFTWANRTRTSFDINSSNAGSTAQITWRAQTYSL
jgi:hypothetical protein